MLKYRVQASNAYTEAISCTLSISGARLTELPDGLPFLSIEPRVGQGLELVGAVVDAFGFEDVPLNLLRVKLGAGLEFSPTGAITATGAVAGGASVTVSPGPPLTATSGNLWWDTDDGTLRIYYVGLTASQWVDAVPVPAASVTSVFGRTGTVVALNNDYVLNLLGDVVVTAPTTGQMLRYDGTHWVNVSGFDLSGNLVVGGTVFASDFVLTGGSGSTSGLVLDSLDDVDTSTVPPTNGQALVFDSSIGVSGKWVPGAGAGGGGAVASVFGRTGTVVAVEGDYSLNLIGGVTITTATSGQVLRYDGAEWRNAALLAGDVPNLDAGKITSGVLGTARGGTGLGIYTAGGYVYAVTTSVLGQRTSADVLTDIAAAPLTRTLTLQGTTNQVTVTGGGQTLAADRTWTLSLPQNIHSAATPTFAGLTINGPVSFTGVHDVVFGTDPGGIGKLRVGGNLIVGGTIYAEDFVLVGGSGSGIGLDLNSLDDVTVSAPYEPTNGQALVYDDGLLQWIPGTVASTLVVQKAGVVVGSRQTLNFIEGSGVTLTVVDNEANGRVNVTITSSGSGSTATLSGGDLTGTYQVTEGVGLRFGAAAQTNTNDGFIVAGVLGTGLNLVGTQTSGSTGRLLRIWGSLIDSTGVAYVKNTGTWDISINGSASSLGGLSPTTVQGLVDTNYVEVTVFGDSTTSYYPVVIAGGALFGNHQYSVSRQNSWQAPDSWSGSSTDRGSLTLTIRWSGDGAAGKNDQDVHVLRFHELYSNMVGGLSLAAEGLVVWLRGGGAGGARYRIHGPAGANTMVTPHVTGFTSSNSVVFPVRSNLDAVSTEITDRYSRRGNSLYSDGYSVIKAQYNTSLNSDTRNNRGVTRLYRRDANTDFSLQMYWGGTRWRLYGYAGDTADADTHVGYADTAGRARPQRSDNTNIDFVYSAVGGQPTGLWGTTDGLTMNVYNPSNFSVNSSVQLTTTRTIWGQNFNGTANVSGALSGATTGVFSSNVTALDFVLSSDIRLKRELTPLTGMLTALDNLQAYRYYHTQNERWEVGVVAQEWQKVVPEVVTEDKHGMLGVTYDRLVPALLAMVKELKERVVALENRS